jgi:DinB superfamily
MTDERPPAELAKAIDDARQRLIGFADSCTAEHWQATPVDGDPRPVGLIADHVANAYEYLAGWIGDLLAGKPVAVDAEVVDGLNADHAGVAGPVTAADVVAHLQASGDAIISLVGSLQAEQLELGSGQVRRFAHIAARHADSHRTEIEEALAAASA